MAFVEVKVVEDLIPELVAKVNASARAAVKHVADKITVTMRQIEPVETGEMRDTTQSVSLTAGYEAGVEIGVDYWEFPNYGTRHQPAQNFVEQAVDMHLHELDEEIMAAFVL